MVQGTLVSDIPDPMTGSHGRQLIHSVRWGKCSNKNSRISIYTNCHWYLKPVPSLSSHSSITILFTLKGAS